MLIARPVLKRLLEILEAGNRAIPEIARPP
jgi:hypothetical protein